MIQFLSLICVLGVVLVIFVALLRAEIAPMRSKKHPWMLYHPNGRMEVDSKIFFQLPKVRNQIEALRSIPLSKKV